MAAAASAAVSPVGGSPPVVLVGVPLEEPLEPVVRVGPSVPAPPAPALAPPEPLLVEAPAEPPVLVLTGLLLVEVPAESPVEAAPCVETAPWGSPVAVPGPWTPPVTVFVVPGDPPVVRFVVVSVLSAPLELQPDVP